MNTHAATQRTAGPWEANRSGRGAICAYHRAGRQVVAQVAMHTDPTYNDGEDSANAAFIVKACNAHDEIVAALLALSDDCNTAVDNMSEWNGTTLRSHIFGMQERARAALAKLS